MELNNKIGTLNTYELITKYLQRPNITSHISKHLSSATMKPVDAVFSSVINDSFIILKFQENQKSSNYFKYLAYSNTYDRLDISSSKSIADVGYNNTSFYYILSIGNTFSIITPDNEINYETLVLKDSIKLSNEIGKKYIIKIACGEKHCLFLTHAGMIYTMGDNSYGQLGVGENHITKENKEGILLKDLLNYRINDICAGKNHSFCFGVVRELTKAGNAGPNNIEFDPKRPYYLFGWGDNSFYQLGMKQCNTFNTILRPTKICCNNNMNNPAIIGEELINISCGLNFSALLFANGKLLTFGDNQYNQLIFKEKEITPNNTNNYLPKKIGKIRKIITGGNSIMLMSEFNKLIIFGKYNEPNNDQITIVDLINNCENNKYIFNDNILKVIIFNNEMNVPETIKNITNVKISEFLVNTPKIEKNNKTENITNNNEVIEKEPCDSISNKNNEINNKNNNPKNKNINNKDVNNKTLDAIPTKKHLKLNSNLNNSSTKNTNILGEPKKPQYKNSNIIKKNKTIKYKNSYSKISHLSNDKVVVTDALGVYQNNNTKNKTENKTLFNGAEKKSDNSKNLKGYESNGKSNQIKNNENNQELKLKIEENNLPKEKEKEITNQKSNGNITDDNENENGKANQNIIINQIELDSKTFLNKNILKSKNPTIQNRYEDNYDSFNLEEKNKDISITKEKKEDKIEKDKKEQNPNQNNGGNLKNGKNNNQVVKDIKINDIKINNLKENIENKPIKEITEIKKNENLDVINNINKNKNDNTKINDNINDNNNIKKTDVIKNDNNIISKNNINNKVNIDNNISNNSIKNINNFQNNKKESINQQSIKLQNIDNNSQTFNNINANKNQDKINIENIRKYNNNNNTNNCIIEKNNKPNQTQQKNNNISISKIPEKNNLNNFNKNKNNVIKENNKNNSTKVIKEITQVKNIENKDNSNIFRELGQFVSSTMNKINKYTKNRTDIKKDAFFEKIITGNFTSNLRSINPKILLNNIISGVPNRYRGRLWLKCIGNQLSITPDYFDINLSKFYEKYEDSKESKYILPFPYLGIFKENTPLTLDLCDVINGFIISRPDIKYNEKISYLVGMLIINMDKYQAYVSFMNLILNPNIIIYYLSSNKDEQVMEYGYSNTPTGEEDTNVIKNKKIPSIVEKNLRRVIFKQLLFHNLPDLCSNLELLNVLPEDYFDEWNQTIFSKNFNVDIAMKIWDLFVVQGEKIIFDAGIAIMKELEDELNNCEEKEEALDILLNSQLREINEINVMKNMQQVEYPDWIQSEVLNMTEDTVIPVNFNKN